jgi:hypothetical protein
MHVEESVHGLIEGGICLGQLRKLTKIICQESRRLVEFTTRHVENTNQKCYCLQYIDHYV